MGFSAAAAFSSRALQPQRGNKNAVLDWFLFKKNFLAYLLYVWMPKNCSHWPENIKATIRTRLSSHQTYRKELNPYPDPEKPDAPERQVLPQWRNCWPSSAEKFVELLEAVVYDTEFHASIKNGVKNRKTPEEMLAYVQVKERFTDIENAISDEKNPKPESGAPGISAAGNAGSAAETACSPGGAAHDAMPEAADSKEAEEKADFDDKWRKHAVRKLGDYITLLSEPPTETQLTQVLKAQLMSKERKGERGQYYAAGLFTAGLGSESITEPHLRGAPFKK